MTTIPVIARDGTALHLDRDLFTSRSSLIADMLEDVAEDEHIDPIPLSNADCHSLCLIQSYLANYRNKKIPRIERPIRTNILEDVFGVSDWDVQFLTALTDLDLDRLMHTAHYLDINEIVELCCAKIAVDTKGPTWEEMEMGSEAAWAKLLDCKNYKLKNNYTLNEEGNWLKQPLTELSVSATVCHT